MEKDSAVGFGEGPRPEEEVRKRVVVFDSPDIVASIGRPDLLEERASGHEIVRERAVRSDVLLQMLAGSPAPEGAPGRLADSVRTTAADVRSTLVIFSIHSDLFARPVYRHASSGWLMAPDSELGDQYREWIEANCELAPALSLDDTARNLSRIVAMLQREGRALVVFNVSTYDPAERTHRFTPGSSDPFSVHANRLIAALENMATEVGISVVDVDGAVAELGAAEHVPEPGAFSDEAADFITEDVELLIDQSQVLGSSMQAAVMRVEVPAYDRRTTFGMLATWHVEPGDLVGEGDPLFDVRFDGLVYRAEADPSLEDRRKARKRADRRRASIRAAMVLEVFAGSGGSVSEITISEGQRVKVGDTAAVVTSGLTEGPIGYDESTPTFRLGVKVKAQ